MSISNQRGAVLLLVLVVVALLSALLTDWAFSTLVDLRLTETFRDSNRAYYLARGGVEVGRQLLREDSNPGYDAPTEMWGIGVPAYPVSDEATVSITIVDEDGRFNLNKVVLSDNPDVVMRPRFVRLLKSMDIADSEAEALSEALVDWIDNNDWIYGGGAENSWYQGLTPPLACKNAPLDTVDELLLVKGFTPEIVLKLAPFVTVAPIGKINLNTASPELLLAWDKSLSANDIEPLLTWRETKQIESTNKEIALGGPNNPANIKLNVTTDFGYTSNYYRIIAEARVGDGIRTVEALIDKSNKRLLWRRVY